MNFFEYQELRTQRSVAFKPTDIVEWPDITVTEGEPNEDQLLELSLMVDGHE